MKTKVVNGLIILKRIALVSLTLWVISTLGRLEILRQRANTLAFASAKMLEMRLASVEEKMGKTATAFENGVSKRRTRTTPSAQSRAALKGMISTSGYFDEVAWVAGNGRTSYAYAKRGKSVIRKSSNGTFRGSPLYEAHHKGQVVVSDLEYTPKSIPVFHVSYPLDVRDGGFLLSRVNLWEFLKLPTTLAQDMINHSFDFEVRDQDGKLLAHRVSPPDPIGKLATRFLVARAEISQLNMTVQLTPTRDALLDALKPGRLIWYCLGVAVLLCFLL